MLAGTNRRTFPLPEPQPGWQLLSQHPQMKGARGRPSWSWGEGRMLLHGREDGSSPYRPEMPRPVCRPLPSSLSSPQDSWWSQQSGAPLPLITPDTEEGVKPGPGRESDAAGGGLAREELNLLCQPRHLCATHVRGV